MKTKKKSHRWVKCSCGLVKICAKDDCYETKDL